jgi:hypothetical protein
MSKNTTKDFIEGIYKKEGINNNYARTLATLTKSKTKLKTTAEVGDVVLLVTKKGFENISSHVGTVTVVTDKNYTFQTETNGTVKTIVSPYNFLAKSGMVTVGFFTVK